MPCLKKCKCGKEEKFFQFLNDDEIEAFECDSCPKEEPKKEEAKAEVVEKIEESPKEESAKSEDKKSRKKKQKSEDKPE